MEFICEMPDLMSNEKVSSTTVRVYYSIEVPQIL